MTRKENTKMSELYDPNKHRAEIMSLIAPAVTEYQQLLINAGVAPEDVVVAVQKVTTISTEGRRKAERFASFINSIKT